MLITMGMMIGRASGKVGSHVCSHNKGGPYMRLASLVTNPNTPEQQIVRDGLASLSTRWRDTLTQDQRDQWTAYAAGSPIVNRMGESRTIPPLAMYVRCNTIRLQTGRDVADDAPITNGDGTLTAPTVTVIDAHPGNNALVVDGTMEILDSWYVNGGTNTTSAGLAFFFSKPQNETIEFFNGPYRLGFVMQPGDAANFTAKNDPFPAGADQKVFWRAIAMEPDGRITNEIRGSIVAT